MACSWVTGLWGLRWYAIAAASWILGVVAGFSLLGNAVDPALVAASIMVILVKASPLRQRNRIVSWMASRSFCIYLVHQRSWRSWVRSSTSRWARSRVWCSLWW